MEDICIDYCEASICPDDCKYLNATDEERAEANRRIFRELDVQVKQTSLEEM